MDTIDIKKTTYSNMRTISRLNYRTDCCFDPKNIAGVLEKGVTVKLSDKFNVQAHGYKWGKIKLGHKEYFVCTDWLEPI